MDAHFNHLMWRLFAMGCLLVGMGLCGLFITGCGGGDPAPDVPPPGVDCKANPELCK